MLIAHHVPLYIRGSLRPAFKVGFLQTLQIQGRFSSEFRSWCPERGWRRRKGVQERARANTRRPTGPLALPPAQPAVPASAKKAELQRLPRARARAAAPGSSHVRPSPPPAALGLRANPRPLPAPPSACR